MNNIKDSIENPNTTPKTIVIDSIQLRSAEDRPYVDSNGNPYTGNDKLNDREPILEPVNINTKSEESISKSELKIGVGDNKSTGIATAYLKNKLVEISDDLITIKDGTNEGGVLFTIKVNANKDLSVSVPSLNEALVLNSSGQIKKMLISDSMIVESIPSASEINSYSNGQLLFVKGS